MGFNFYAWAFFIIITIIAGIADIILDGAPVVGRWGMVTRTNPILGWVLIIISLYLIIITAKGYNKFKQKQKISKLEAEKQGTKYTKSEFLEQELNHPKPLSDEEFARNLELARQEKKIREEKLRQMSFLQRVMHYIFGI